MVPNTPILSSHTITTKAPISIDECHFPKNDSPRYQIKSGSKFKTCASLRFLQASSIVIVAPLQISRQEVFFEYMDKRTEQESRLTSLLLEFDRCVERSWARFTFRIPRLVMQSARRNSRTCQSSGGDAEQDVSIRTTPRPMSSGGGVSATCSRAQHTGTTAQAS
jgi:hypothetical protein